MRAIHAIAILCTAAFAGCETPPTPPSKLVKPAYALMIAPEPLPDVAEGQDVIQAHASLRRSYGRETNKLRRLQRYVRTVTK